MSELIARLNALESKFEALRQEIEAAKTVTKPSREIKFAAKLEKCVELNDLIYNTVKYDLCNAYGYKYAKIVPSDSTDYIDDLEIITEPPGNLKMNANVLDICGKYSDVIAIAIPTHTTIKSDDRYLRIYNNHIKFITLNDFMEMPEVKFAQANGISFDIAPTASCVPQLMQKYGTFPNIYTPDFAAWRKIIKAKRAIDSLKK